MFRYSYTSRSGYGPALGCGCLMFVILLMIILVRLFWLLLPLIILAALGIWLYNRLTDDGADSRESEGPSAFYQDSSSNVSQSGRRPIKEAEVIEDDED